jgi:hypothetical protein
MSRYQVEPLDFTGLHTIPLSSRGGKVRVEHFARPYQKGAGVAALIDSLPSLLAANTFRDVVKALRESRSRKRAIIWGLGGHVIKCGLAPVLIDLMDRGFATAFAMNGAAAIHDYEIALCGQTSEDVEAVLPDGRFGVARENINSAVRADMGLGEALGCAAGPQPDSLLAAAFSRGIPITVHVAIGTDTPHIHPDCDPAALGAATHRDFRLFCALVRELNDGGVYINAGSAVVLPEVFLKAVSAVRNLGHPLRDFTTVNLDFLQHYRPRHNVVQRPHANAGGHGYEITGHHELTIPLLAAALVEAAE